MVRVNLLNPRKLSDQHLIAEYLELLMLVGSIKQNFDVSRVPETYRLGKGHINFFKNKLLYLKKRHTEIRKEMRRRGFNVNKKLNISRFNRRLKNDFSPTEKDFKIIKRRLLEKLKQKDGWYRYCGEVKDSKFLSGLL